MENNFALKVPAFCHPGQTGYLNSVIQLSTQFKITPYYTEQSKRNTYILIQSWCTTTGQDKQYTCRF